MRNKGIRKRRSKGHNATQSGVIVIAASISSPPNEDSGESCPKHGFEAETGRWSSVKLLTQCVEKERSHAEVPARQSCQDDGSENAVFCIEYCDEW